LNADILNPLLSQIVLISTILSFVVLSSTAIYIAFYQLYVPALGAEYPLHFNFSNKTENPVATVPISLARNQEYDATVMLELPESPVNYQIGMFMVQLDLLPDKLEKTSSRTLSRRPCVVHYKSDLLLMFETIFFAIPLVLGLTEQKQTHRIKVIDAALNSRATPFTVAKVALSDPSILVHAASIRFDIQLHNLRYLMYYYPFTTAAVSIAIMSAAGMLALAALYFQLMDTILEDEEVEQYRPQNRTGSVDSDVEQEPNHESVSTDGTGSVNRADIPRQRSISRHAQASSVD